MDYTVSSAEAFETSASNAASSNNDAPQEMSKLIVAHANETAGDLAAYSTWYSIF